MERSYERLKHFLLQIAQLPLGPLHREDLLTPDFLLERRGELEIYYAPHNEYINVAAKVCIVGITPGWNQMERAYRQVRDDLQSGIGTAEEIAKRAKESAAFVGSMRQNLCAMLDELGVSEWAQVGSTQELFAARRDLLHTTSLVRDPVFVQGRNYTGHTPKLSSSPLLRRYVEEEFSREMQMLQSPLLIPLGKSVADALEPLIEQGILDRERCLLGFPHPSGANGHRKKQFEAARDQLQKQLQKIRL